MAGVRNFTDRLSWQKARDWQKVIWERTQTGPFKFDHRLVVQINDSTDSVMANIAEGFGRGTQGEFVQFLGYSIASVNETQSHLVVAYDRKYVPKAEYGKLFEASTEIRKIIVGFITSMVKPGSGVKHLRPVKSWSEHVWEVYERLTGKPRPAIYVPGSGAKALDGWPTGKPDSPESPQA